MRVRAALALALAGLLLAAAAPARAADAGTIVYVTPTGELRSVRPDGSGDRAIPGGAIESVRASPSPLLVPVAARPGLLGRAADRAAEAYRWPVASPDGSRLLVFGTAPGENGPVDGTYVVDSGNGRIFGVHEKPGIASIYAYWSPDGRHATMLEQAREGLRLALWPVADGKRPAALVETVPPVFWSWAPDSRRLALHTGAREGRTVALHDVARGERTVLSRSPGGFNTPAWSSDGAVVAFPEIEGTDGRIVAARPDGARTTTPASPTVALGWSPRAPVLAVAEGGDRESRFHWLRLVRLSTKGGELRLEPDPKPLLREPFAAFFWSPGGDRILYGHPEGPGFRWKTVDVATRKVRTVGAFLPSPSSRKLLLYFDQYGLSHRMWAPDGRHFVFCGVAEQDLGPGVALDDSRVYVLDASGETPPRRVAAEGDMSVWSAR